MNGKIEIIIGIHVYLDDCMQGLTITKLKFDPFDVDDVGYGELFDRIEMVTITNGLIYSADAFFVLGEVIWKSKPNIRYLKKFDFITEITELSHIGNRYFYMAHGRQIPFYSEMIEALSTELYCFFEYPIIYTKDYVTVQLVGKRNSISKCIGLFKDLDLSFDILYIKNFHIKGGAILSELTERQYDCMKMATDSGYFSIPRRTNLRKLASKMKITHGAFAFHLRKSQRTIFQALFE